MMFRTTANKRSLDCETKFILSLLLSMTNSQSHGNTQGKSKENLIFIIHHQDTSSARRESGNERQISLLTSGIAWFKTMLASETLVIIHVEQVHVILVENQHTCENSKILIPQTYAKMTYGFGLDGIANLWQMCLRCTWKNLPDRWMCHHFAFEFEYQHPYQQNMMREFGDLLDVGWSYHQRFQRVSG